MYLIDDTGKIINIRLDNIDTISTTINAVNNKVIFMTLQFKDDRKFYKFTEYNNNDLIKSLYSIMKYTKDIQGVSKNGVH